MFNPRISRLLLLQRQRELLRQVWRRRDVISKGQAAQQFKSGVQGGDADRDGGNQVRTDKVAGIGHSLHATGRVDQWDKTGRLAAAVLSVQPNNGADLSAVPRQARADCLEQIFHATSCVAVSEKRRCIAVFGWRGAVDDMGQVGDKLFVAGDTREDVGAGLAGAEDRLHRWHLCLTPMGLERLSLAVRELCRRQPSLGLFDAHGVSYWRRYRAGLKSKARDIGRVRCPRFVPRSRIPVRNWSRSSPSANSLPSANRNSRPLPGRSPRRVPISSYCSQVSITGAGFQAAESHVLRGPI